MKMACALAPSREQEYKMRNLSCRLRIGSHSYVQDKFTITRMANDEWYIFDDAGRDTGLEFKTLAAARKYILHHSAETVCGRF